MVIKTKDSLDPALDVLNGLLANPSLTPDQRKAIEDEVWKIRSGAKGERDAAYHIDFRLKDAKNYMVLHDLRLEYNGRVAQIDHLIIGRFLDFILIESKNFGTAIRANAEGEFEVKTRYGWRGMASPVEQSKRHAEVLLDLLRNEGLIPKRLGYFSISPVFHHWICVPPECNVVQKPTDATLLKTDLFGKYLDQWIDRHLCNPLKVCYRETIEVLADALIQRHQPMLVNYAARFGLDSPQPSPPIMEEVVTPVLSEIESPLCEACGVFLEAKVVAFCKQNKARFAGKVLCRDCQKSTSNSGPACFQCGASVEAKVVAFCRFNRGKFGGQIFCRECQTGVIEKAGSAS